MELFVRYCLRSLVRWKMSGKCQENVRYDGKCQENVGTCRSLESRDKFIYFFPKCKWNIFIKFLWISRSSLFNLNFLGTTVFSRIADPLACCGLRDSVIFLSTYIFICWLIPQFFPDFANFRAVSSVLGAILSKTVFKLYVNGI